MFVLRSTQNTQIHCVGRTQKPSALNLVVQSDHWAYRQTASVCYACTSEDVKKKSARIIIKMLSVNNKLCVSLATHTHTIFLFFYWRQSTEEFILPKNRSRRTHSSENSIKKSSFFRKINPEEPTLPKIQSKRTHSSENSIKKNAFFRKFNKKRTHSSENSIKKNSFFRKFNQEELILPKIPSRRTHSSENSIKNNLQCSAHPSVTKP